MTDALPDKQPSTLYALEVAREKLALYYVEHGPAYVGGLEYSALVKLLDAEIETLRAAQAFTTTAYTSAPSSTATFDAESALAGLADCINLGIRENGRWDDQIKGIKDDMRPFVNRLIDYVRENERFSARSATASIPDPVAVYVELGVDSDIHPKQVDAVLRAATKLMRKQGSARAEAADIPEGCTPTDAMVLRKANGDLAQESSQLRVLLSELVEAVDGCNDMDEADGEDYWTAANKLDIAMERAKPFTEAALLSKAQTDLPLSGPSST